MNNLSHGAMDLHSTNFQILQIHITTTWPVFSLNGQSTLMSTWVFLPLSLEIQFLSSFAPISQPDVWQYRHPWKCKHGAPSLLHKESIRYTTELKYCAVWGGVARAPEGGKSWKNLWQNESHIGNPGYGWWDRCNRCRNHNVTHSETNTQNKYAKLLLGPGPALRSTVRQLCL